MRFLDMARVKSSRVEINVATRTALIEHGTGTAPAVFLAA
ncbi:hypothetical protein JOF55_001576 [Haloactinomyces albus]|uniref:Uncharacterized protein n=1 Tax=Haloactinomyces albus TaxID=1352928 RepID=A0AAE3ZCL6_9ACTN|nr:hypothetical protein [Haloactinomyces albus]